MYVIVVGGGKVGYYLTKTLLSEGFEVLLIERNADKVETFAERFGAVVIAGDGAEASTLAAAGAGRADVVIAVTGEDEDNLVICQMAKQKFHVGRTIARVNVMTPIGFPSRKSGTPSMVRYGSSLMSSLMVYSGSVWASGT